jgi:predicted nucleotidyltransferase
LYGEELNVNSDVRCKIAREAATLLYFGAEKEYKQAKLKAAKTLCAYFLPSNLEVALELDKIAEERLIQMRKEALKLMVILKKYGPILIGSVWRGTIRQGSDIDIAVYHDVADEILNVLKESGIKISKTEWTTATKRGKPESSFHIYVQTASKQMAELVVRNSEEARHRRKCEIFGDEIKGLNIQELKRLLKENPAQNFIPL